MSFTPAPSTAPTSEPALYAGAQLTVDLDALAANYRTIADEVAPAHMAAVVKADGYGLGARRVAAVFARQGCRVFFVAELGEAIALKPALPADAELFVLNGVRPGAERLCADLGAMPVLNAFDQARRWADLADMLGRPLPAPLQIDTGMSRLGMSFDELDSLLGQPGFFDKVPLRLLMSHLACADDSASPANDAQRRRFAELSARLPAAPRSLANSGGSFLGEPFRQDLVRAGISLYGGAPNEGRPNPMRPVIAITARVIQLRTIPAGTGVGYGLTFTSTRETRLATIAIGYADGLPRALGGMGAAWFDGVRLPIAGRVSMDSIILDISALPEGRLSPGDSVEIVGPHQSLDELAADAGTIAYEILTSLGPRYARHYIGAAS